MNASCRGCHAALPPMKRPGRARVWCSEACRLRALRREQGLWTCVDAGRRACLHCRVLFTPKRSHQAYCSQQCGWQHRAQRRPRSGDWAAGRQPERILPCMDCGKDVVTRGSRVCCEQCRMERARNTSRRRNVKRRGTVTLIKYTLNEIGERDGWRCHLCRRVINRKLPGTHQRGPTIDHLVPLSHGGTDEPMNVAVAHRACNVRRGTGGVVQLRMSG